MGSEDISKALPKKAEKPKCDSEQNPPVTFPDVDRGDTAGLRHHGFLSPPSFLSSLPTRLCLDLAPCQAPGSPTCCVYSSLSLQHIDIPCGPRAMQTRLPSQPQRNSLEEWSLWVPSRSAPVHPTFEPPVAGPAQGHTLQPLADSCPGFQPVVGLPGLPGPSSSPRPGSALQPPGPAQSPPPQEASRPCCPSWPGAGARAEPNWQGTQICPFPGRGAPEVGTTSWGPGLRQGIRRLGPQLHHSLAVWSPSLWKMGEWWLPHGTRVDLTGGVCAGVLTVTGSGRGHRSPRHSAEPSAQTSIEGAFHAPHSDVPHWGEHSPLLGPSTA